MIHSSHINITITNGLSDFKTTIFHKSQTPLIRCVVDLLWTCCGLVVDLVYNISTCCGFVVDFRCHSQNCGRRSVLLHFMAVVGILKDSKNTFTVSVQ